MPKFITLLLSCLLILPWGAALSVPNGKGGIVIKRQSPFPPVAHVETPVGYGSGVPFKGGVLTANHVGAEPGSKITIGKQTRTVTSSRQIKIATISGGPTVWDNEDGDVMFLTLDRPFVFVRDAQIRSSPVKHGTRVIVSTQFDGIRHERIVLGVLARANRYDILPPFLKDINNPAWNCYDADPESRARILFPVIPGDSGGGVYDRDGKLVGLITRGGMGQGPNLTDPKFKP